jgi:hypothetical protein
MEQFGSGIRDEKSRIRDKDPGSATLGKTFPFLAKPYGTYFNRIKTGFAWIGLVLFPGFK